MKFPNMKYKKIILRPKKELLSFILRNISKEILLHI